MNNKKHSKQVLRAFDKAGIFIVDMKERPTGDLAIYNSDKQESYLVKFDDTSFTIFEEIEGDEAVMLTEEYSNES